MTAAPADRVAASRLVGVLEPGAVLLRYGNDPSARYFLDLDIYGNEPIPVSGGPA
jgi:hypothetical protein